MRIGKSTRLGRSWIVMAGALGLPREALAGWGDDWGAMVWGAGASAVPSLGWLGLAILAMGLAATAAWTLRKRRPALGLTLSLVLLVIPLAVAAGTVSVPNTFVNGTVADADQVNANFSALATESNAQDARLLTLETSGIAGYSQVVANMTIPAGTTRNVVAVCPVGTRVIGGGYRIPATTIVLGNRPVSASQWAIEARAPTTGASFVEAFAICAQ